MVDLEQSPSLNSGLSRKRRRAKVACESCRTRKRKCDGQEPCGTCVQLEYDCHYCPTIKAPKGTPETPRCGQASTDAVEPAGAGQNPVADTSHTAEPPYLLNLENHARYALRRGMGKRRVLMLFSEYTRTNHKQHIHCFSIVKASPAAVHAFPCFTL